MRIDFRVDGGIAAFPGLAKPVTIDCDTLPLAEMARLRELLHRADFFAQPAQASARGGPDARRYTISVEDGGRCSTVSVAEPIGDPALRDLVTELRAHAKAARRGL